MPNGQCQSTDATDIITGSMYSSMVVPLNTFTGYFGDNFTGQSIQPTASQQ